MFVLAGYSAFLRELQLLAETVDIALVHLAKCCHNIGRRGGIVAQVLQRHQDLVVAAL